ncbi:hypothetical protein BT96DRAFT_979375 [Gymnopus androsaceus JB14]|uniref:MYND-type domain-containing protein n=1 Tax=Gymnopus androsaceus JB14 TaxID=1447944 RepID=A0A6A4H3Z2_9AGAR|nr:hypothetical protein BT96DRAFT_979375 [Gymnopus androsaceus JB14]
MSEKRVVLPLKSFEKCVVCCRKTSDLKLCSLCNEETYCSKECQTAEWVKHKKICGKNKTDKIPLEGFHPFLAVLAESNRTYILNSPNPYVHPTALPDGTSAKLVVLGDPVPPEDSLKKWWPTAQSDKVSSKLRRRFLREGHLLPIITTMLVALLGEMYTSPYNTTSDDDTNNPNPPLRRTRLSYKSSPIADFGIVKGKVRVNASGYVHPNDHYWIYFTTLKGEELVLDLGMFTFNMCTMVCSDPYVQLDAKMPPVSWSPCYFKDRIMARNTPMMHTETGRVSVLRNTDLHRFVEREDEECNTLFRFMDSFSSRPLTHEEKLLTIDWLTNNTLWTKHILKTRCWVNWPKEPQIAIEQDPGEEDHVLGHPVGYKPGYKEGYKEDDWWKYVTKMSKKYNEGKITSLDALGDRFRRWKGWER